MEESNFKNLVAKRQKWVQSSAENKFDFDNILTGIYNDPSHFIYEILQNAEDAGANNIIFCLYDDRLEIDHNGKDFSFNDVDGISGIGISTKKENLNTIGKFGVGFKSVFAITQTPIIHSGNFHFRIEDFVIPTVIGQEQEINTKIILPFNHPTRSKDDIFQLVYNKLVRIDLRSILFLSNIKSIKWKYCDESGHYYKITQEIENYDNVKNVSLISDSENSKVVEKYLVFQRRINIDEAILKVELAYKLEQDDVGKEKIIKEKKSTLVVFFPTEKETFLNFIIHGPYRTTPNRENIPLDNEQNKMIIEETAILVSDSMPIIQALGLLNSYFLDVLPINQNHRDKSIYSSIFNSVKEKLKSEEKLLPGISGTFTSSSMALLARGKDLTELLTNDDIEFLYGKNNWIDRKITSDRAKELRDYLIKELEIKEISFEDFAADISTEFLERKSDEWMIRFYSILIDQKSLWTEGGYSRNAGILRQQPLLRLADGVHIEPCDRNKKIQVYLPSETKSRYKTIKESLTVNELSLEFLKELGLTVPSIFSEIDEFILPKYQDSDIQFSLEEFLDDFEKIIIAHKKESSEKKKQLFKEIQRSYIIHATNPNNAISLLKRPNQVYIETPELITYFGEDETFYFPSQLLINRFDSDNLIELFKTLGCIDRPRRIRFDPEFSLEEKKKLRNDDQYVFNEKLSDYDYKGSDNFLKNPTFENSILLWSFILRSINNIEKSPKKYYFMGKYEWEYRPYRSRYTYTNSVMFESSFLLKLKNNHWLFNKSGNICKPNEITFDELSNEYEKDNEDIEVLIKILNFKLDEIRSIETKTGKKVILSSQKEFTEFLQWKIQREKNKEGKEDDDIWIPIVDPDSVETCIEVIDLPPIETSDLRNQEVDTTSTNNNIDTTIYSSIQTSDNTHIKNIKDIGKWGEEHVFKYLKEKYKNDSNAQVIWLNQEDDRGKGYDFKIKMN